MLSPTRSRFALFAATLVTALVFITGAEPVAAHDASEGSVIIVIHDEGVVISAHVAYGDVGFVDTSGDGLLDTSELQAQQARIAPTLVATARENTDLAVDGEPLQIVGAGVPSLGDTEETAASPTVLLVMATSDHDGRIDDVSLGWSFTSPSPTVLLSSSDRAITGELSESGTIDFSLDTWSSTTSFFALGIDHIRYGLDHLLFLFVLTLAAVGTIVSRATTWRTIKLVTAFTVGHAVSLCLAYFNVLSVPSAIVEPAISLSIVIAAVLAIRGHTETRPWLAGAVGLVHGLGFASNLGSLGIVASQRVAALAAFNIGIDVAQTAVVLVVIAGLWMAEKMLADRTAWLRVAGALGAAAFGLGWTASRLAEIVV